MKKVMVLIFFFGFYFTVHAQNVVIAADRNNELYVGVYNPISVAVENYPADKIVVKADHGDIIGSGRKYIYRGTEPGNIQISVYRESNMEKIAGMNFRLKYIPDPVAKVGPYGNGDAIAAVLKSQQFIKADLQNFNADVRFFVDSFTINIFYRDSCLVKELFNTGDKFSAELSTALQPIKKGDIVMFKNIYITGPEGKQRLISPVVLTVTDENK